MNTPTFLRPLAFILTLLVGGSALVPFTSCKEDVVLKTTDVKLVADVTLDLLDPTDSLTGTWAREIVPDSNVNVRDNRRKIEKVSVERIAYRVVESTDSVGTTASGTWAFYLSDTPAQVFTLGTASNLNLRALDDANTVLDLTLNDEAKIQLADAIKNNRAVTFVFTGGVSRRPSYTRFEVQLYTKIDVGV